MPVQWQPLVMPRDSRPGLVLRNALAFAHMYWAHTASMRYVLGLRFGGSWRTRAAMRAAQWLGRASASPRGIRQLDTLYAALVSRSAETAHYLRAFRRMRPSILLCSNQRSGSVVPAVLAAKSLGIPTATFIFSWDNLTSKGRIAASFDYYLVWSDLMRAGAEAFLSRTCRAIGSSSAGRRSSIRMATPGLLWSREEFCRRIGADPSRPAHLLLRWRRRIYPERRRSTFACCSERSWHGRNQGRPQVMLRPSPVDRGSRYDAIRRDSSRS